MNIKNDLMQAGPHYTICFMLGRLISNSHVGKADFKELLPLALFRLGND